MAVTLTMKKRKMTRKSQPKSDVMSSMIIYHYPILWLALGVPASLVAPKQPHAPATVAAAERGKAEAQFQAARACLRGEGVPKDVHKAFALMKAAADLGHADAIGGLGYFYSAGIAVAKDESQAAEWFRKGAAMGSAKAQLNLGEYLIDGKRGNGRDAKELREEGLQWIRKAADQGLPEAALAYGSILYFGDHEVAQDYGKAPAYFKRAAGQGSRDAQNFLGVMNKFGLGMTVDTAAAERWFRKAALQGHLKAQSNLGNLLNPLAENKAVRIEALAWLVLASDQHEATAEKSLRDALPDLKDGDLDAAKIRAEELRKRIQAQ